MFCKNWLFFSGWQRKQDQHKYNSFTENMISKISYQSVLYRIIYFSLASIRQIITVTVYEFKEIKKHIENFHIFQLYNFAYIVDQIKFTMSKVK